MDGSLIDIGRKKADANESTQLFSHHFNGSVLWNYFAEPSPETLSSVRLTKLAEKKRWNPHLDIEWWHTAVNKQFPCSKEADQFSGFAPYDRLPREKRIQISWQRHSMEISEILHGEQLALMCASQLISLMPCMESRLFASTQAADEARHVEFFRRYLATIGFQVHQPSGAIRQLTIEALQNPSWEVKLLVCQILIESLALAQFSHLLRTHTHTALQQGLRRIVDDEARHVKFGTDYLKAFFQQHFFQQHNTQQLSDYAHYVVDKAFELAASDNHCVAIANTYQWDMHALRHHLRLQRILKPALGQQRFRQLSLNIKAIGLMNNTIEQRLKRFAGS
jgi:rubrerythrin